MFGLNFGQPAGLNLVSLLVSLWRHPNRYQNKRVPNCLVFRNQKTCRFDSPLGFLIRLWVLQKRHPNRYQKQTGTKMPSCQKSKTYHFDTPLGFAEAFWSEFDLNLEAHTLLINIDHFREGASKASWSHHVLANMQLNLEVAQKILNLRCDDKTRTDCKFRKKKLQYFRKSSKKLTLKTF